MGAIAGIIHLNDAPVNQQDLEKMAKTLNGLGPDKEKIISHEGMGLVFKGAYITPEDRLETQPLKGHNGIYLVADARIDNREDLAELIGLTKNDIKFMSDSDIILHAYHKWGEDFTQYLVGVFTIVIWHQREKKLLCFRDQSGTRFLYFYQKKNTLYFSTAPRGLFALSHIPRELNKVALADTMLCTPISGDATLYQDIHLVPQASRLRFCSQGINVYQYWDLNPEKKIFFKTDIEYQEAFRTLLTSVITSYLRCTGPIGATLSGGLDSSAIVCEAAKQLMLNDKIIHTATMVPPKGTPFPCSKHSYNDETPKVERIKDLHKNIDAHFICPIDKNPFENMDQRAHYFEMPGGPPTLKSSDELIGNFAKEKGIRVMLNGGKGNTTMSYDGIQQLTALARKGDWLRWLQECFAYSKFANCSVKGLIFRSLLRPNIPNTIRKIIWQVQKRPWKDYSLINQYFAQETGADKRCIEKLNKRLFWHGMNAWEQRKQTLIGRNFGGGNGYRYLERYGYESRLPLNDRRIVEFCMALPPEQYFNKGVSRRLARESLKGLVPQEILMDTRRGKQDLDWAIRVNNNMDDLKNLICAFENSKELNEYLDLPRMRKLVEDWQKIDWRHAPQEKLIQYKQGLFQGVSMGHFVEYFNGNNI